jgi:hypothetical protein
LGAKFFSHRTPGRSEGAGNQAQASPTGGGGLDHQQALLLDALRRAAGAPVSYAELRDAGIELPASVVSELELAGVSIQRSFGAGPGAVGVRLDPADDPGAPPAPESAERPMPRATNPELAWSSVRTYRASGAQGLLLGVLGWLSRSTSKGNGVGRRALALAALLFGIAVVFAGVVIWAPWDGRGTRAPIAKRSHAQVVVASGRASPPSPRRSAPPSPPVPVSPALATVLEAQGHSLLQAGRYGDAVPVLRRAVRATGQTVGACREPANSTCLTYAYALYDLGRAVRLSGQPQAAVPILERRLQIDNQRGIVSDELQLARQGVG